MHPYEISKKIISEIKEKHGVELKYNYDKENKIFFIALHKLKSQGKDCEAIAKELIKKYEFLEYENCFLYLKATSALLEKSKDFGFVPSSQNHEKVLVEFSSPNIGKPFNVGHLRSTILGEIIAKMFSLNGKEVIKMNYLGDWGLQFGKLIYAYKKWGNKQELYEKGIKYLLELYVKAHEHEQEIKEQAEKEFIKLEQGDEENTKLWKEFREISLKEFMSTYEMLGVSFDVITGESEFAKKSEEIIKDALNKGVAFVDADKSIVIPLEIGNLVISKKGERSLYATRDLAAAKYKCQELKVSLSLYVVGGEQKQYFQQIFKALEKLGYCKNTKLEHIDFGLLYLPEGKFSTRKGRVVFVDSFINEIESRIEQEAQKRNVSYSKEEIKNLAIATIKIAILSQARRKDFMFSFDKFINFNQDNAIYLLYSIARAKSILANYESLSYDEKEAIKELTSHEDALNLLEEAYKLPYYFEKALDNRDPHYIVSYAFNLAHKYNALYQKTKFINNSKFHNAGKYITKAYLDVMAKILEVLEIKQPSKL